MIGLFILKQEYLKTISLTIKSSREKFFTWIFRIFFIVAILLFAINPIRNFQVCLPAMKEQPIMLSTSFQKLTPKEIASVDVIETEIISHEQSTSSQEEILAEETVSLISKPYITLRGGGLGTTNLLNQQDIFLKSANKKTLVNPIVWEKAEKKSVLSASNTGRNIKALPVKKFNKKPAHKLTELETSLLETEIILNNHARNREFATIVELLTSLNKSYDYGDAGQNYWKINQSMMFHMTNNPKFTTMVLDIAMEARIDENIIGPILDLVQERATSNYEIAQLRSGVIDQALSIEQAKQWVKLLHQAESDPKNTRNMVFGADYAINTNRKNLRNSFISVVDEMKSFTNNYYFQCTSRQLNSKSVWHDIVPDRNVVRKILNEVIVPSIVQTMGLPKNLLDEKPIKKIVSYYYFYQYHHTNPTSLSQPKGIFPRSTPHPLIGESVPSEDFLNQNENGIFDPNSNHWMKSRSENVIKGQYNEKDKDAFESKLETFFEQKQKSSYGSTKIGYYQRIEIIKK